MRRLTPELLDTCLDLESVEILGQQGIETFEGDSGLEIQAFTAHVASSERLRAGFLRVIGALFDERIESNVSVAAAQEHFQELLKSGKVTFKHLQVMEDVCGRLFLLGWHARGVVEQVELLTLAPAPATCMSPG